MATLDPAIVESVANANFKINAEALSTALAQALALQAQNAASHQNRVNVLAEAALAAALRSSTELDPGEAASIASVQNADLAKTLAQMGAAIAAIQQQLKGAQTSLPETGRPEK